MGTRVRRDARTWGRGDVGTWGRGDAGTWGRGDAGTWGRGDAWTWGRWDEASSRDARSGTRGGDKQEEPFSASAVTSFSRQAN